MAEHRDNVTDDCFLPIPGRPTPVMTRGSGSRLWDEEGNEYLDFVQGWASNALGHCPEAVREVIRTQSERLMHVGPGLRSREPFEFARELARHAGLDQVFFFNSGAEANEGALKLARAWGKQERSGAYEVITTEGGFHGRTLAMMAASGKPSWDDLFEPKVPGFVKVPFGDADAVERAIGPATAAIMVEPIQGEAGVVVPPTGYLAALRRLADVHGLLLVLDEVQTGMGRTAKLFAHQWEGTRPDVLTLGKGLGGGMSLSAVVADARRCRLLPGDVGGTFNGNPLVTAVGRRVLEITANADFLARVGAAGGRLERGLRELAAEHGATVRGRGLLWACCLPTAHARAVAAHSLERGLIINAANEQVLRLMPALTVSEGDIDHALATLRLALLAACPSDPAQRDQNSNG